MDQEVEESSETTAMARPEQSVPVFTNDDHRKMMLLFLPEDLSNRRIAGEKG